MLLQIDRRNVRGNVRRRDDGLEALELRHVDNRRLLFRLLLFFLIEEDHRRVDCLVALLLTRGQRRDDRAEDDDAVSDQRHKAKTERTLLVGLLIRLDQVIEHRRPLRAGDLFAK